jgi:hypothetical protein
LLIKSLFSVVEVVFVTGGVAVAEGAIGGVAEGAIGGVAEGAIGAVDVVVVTGAAVDCSPVVFVGGAVADCSPVVVVTGAAVAADCSPVVFADAAVADCSTVVFVGSAVTVFDFPLRLNPSYLLLLFIANNTAVATIINTIIKMCLFIIYRIQL